MKKFVVLSVLASLVSQAQASIWERANIDIATGYNAKQYEIVDFDKDGHLDVVFVGYTNVDAGGDIRVARQGANLIKDGMLDIKNLVVNDGAVDFKVVDFVGDGKNDVVYKTAQGDLKVSVEAPPPSPPEGYTEPGTYPKLPASADGVDGGWGYIVKASSTINTYPGHSANYQPFRAFDQNSAGYWQTYPGLMKGSWIQIEYPTVKRFTSMYFLGGSYVSPKNFTVQGSIDGIAWDILLTLTNVPNETGQTVNIEKPGHYKIYRLVFTDSYHGNYVGLNEIKFYAE